MSKVKVLIPEYVKKFECIGDKCEDTCCKNWNIVVDKNTYKKYKEIRNNKFSPLLGKKILINRNKNSSRDYAYINLNLNENKKCPFLNEKNLCDIYINLGENYMCNTCKVYPRSINKINNDLEMSLTLSCPEAARMALLSDELMKFEYVEIDYKDYMKLPINKLKTDNDYIKKEFNYFWDIRISSIRLLQNRKFNIYDRLLLLGILYKKIVRNINNKKYDSIPNEIDNFIKNVENIDISDIIEKINLNKKIQILILRVLIDEERIGRKYSLNMLDYINGAMKVFSDNEYNNSNDIDEQIISKYNNIMDNYLKEYFCGSKSHIIENYLVNEYFREFMPLGSIGDLWKTLIVLCINYSILKTFMIGYVEKFKNINDEDIINIIYNMSRELTHNSNYYKFLINNIENYELDTLGGLYIMIHN